MNPLQLPLELPHRPALGLEDFLVAPSNETAVGFLDRWPDWPFLALVLHGPGGAGKTHLAGVWRAKSGATDDLDAPDARVVLVDDADRFAGDAAGEERLFHLFERVRGARGQLLLTAKTPPARWGVQLRDLGSRLNAAMVVELAPPDDALLAGVALKLLHDRQLAIGSDALEILLTQSERSIAGIARSVARIDRAGLAAKRKITAQLVRATLADGM